MMGPRQEAQGALFYEFSLENYVPADHLMRSIDRFVDLSGIRAHLEECLKLCVSDRAHAVVRYVQASKRPANIMAS